MPPVPRAVVGVVSLLALLTLASLFTPQVNSASTPSYAITDLGTLSGGDYSIAHGLNGVGQVAGVSSMLADPDDPLQPVFDRAFRWTGTENPKMRNLGTLPGGESSAGYSLNSAGDVVGTSATETGENHPVLWTAAGEIFDLGTLGGSPAEARGINDTRRVVGYSFNAAGFPRAFSWEAGPGIQELPALPNGSISFAHGINAAGQAVGSSTTVTPARNVEEHAVLWTNGAPQDLGTLPGHNRSVAFAINNANPVQVVGYSAYGSLQRAFLWQNGAMQNLGTLSGGSRSAATAVNDRAEVVGWSTISGGAQRAIRWTAATGMVDLNTRIDRSLQRKWSLREARGINSTGQIVGWGYLDGKRRGFLLTPK